MVYVYSFYASYVHHLVVSGSLQPHELWSVSLLFPWNFQGKNTGVGRHFLLQGISLTKRLNLSLLLGWWILYHGATWEAQLLDNLPFGLTMPDLTCCCLLIKSTW